MMLLKSRKSFGSSPSSYSSVEFLGARTADLVDWFGPRPFGSERVEYRLLVE